MITPAVKRIVQGITEKMKKTFNLYTLFRYIGLHEISCNFTCHLIWKSGCDKTFTGDHLFTTIVFFFLFLKWGGEKKKSSLTLHVTHVTYVIFEILMMFEPLYSWWNRNLHDCHFILSEDSEKRTWPLLPLLWCQYSMFLRDYFNRHLKSHQDTF